MYICDEYINLISYFKLTVFNVSKQSNINAPKDYIVLHKKKNRSNLIKINTIRQLNCKGKGYTTKQ